MLRKNIHFLYGGGIGILLIAAVIIFNHYQNSQSQEPVKIYKGTVPSQQVPETEKRSTSPDVTTQPETVDIEETGNAEVEESEEVFEELAPEPDKSNEPSEELLTTAAESPQEDPKVVFLKEMFPKLDHHLSEGKKLVEDIEKEGWTAGNYEVFKARGEALNAEFQKYCRQIADEFPDAVTFITFEGQQWAYDVDFQILQDSLEAVPSELSAYFRHTRLREWFGLPDVTPEQMQQLQQRQQMQPRRR